MNQSTIVVDQSTNYRTIIDLDRQGHLLLCPECGNQLIVAIDPEVYGKLQVHPGIYCSSDHDHFFILIELKVIPDNYWDDFSRRVEEMKKEKQKRLKADGATEST